MRRMAMATAVMLALAACEKREVPPASSTSADSAVAGAAAPDSVPADSTRPDSSRAEPQYIGRDSAFGPLFAVDSTGKAVELPVRRP